MLQSPLGGQANLKNFTRKNRTVDVLLGGTNPGEEEGDLMMRTVTKSIYDRKQSAGSELV